RPSVDDGADDPSPEPGRSAETPAADDAPALRRSPGRALHAGSRLTPETPSSPKNVRCSTRSLDITLPSTRPGDPEGRPDTFQEGFQAITGRHRHRLLPRHAPGVARHGRGCLPRPPPWWPAAGVRRPRR